MRTPRGVVMADHIATPADADVAALQLTAVDHYYGAHHVLKQLDLTVHRKELICLLGPSGCGKTTTLNIVAGFVQPDAGSVVVNGRDLTFVPAHKRNLGMVFQNYALLPHLTIFDNVAFGLRLRKQPSDQIRDTVTTVLSAVGLRHAQTKYPNELSGGEQQRIGLARALAIRPQLILMDEPLSNLDAQLRRNMQQEIRRIHDEFELTSIYVTHDQEEAMVLGDRVAVMHEGVVEQLASPAEVYERPASAFVAHFVGERNFGFATVLKEVGEQLYVRLDDGAELVCTSPSLRQITPGSQVEVTFRQESVVLSHGRADGQNAFSGIIRTISYRGARSQIGIDLGSWPIYAQLDSGLSREFAPGESVTARLPPEMISVFVSHNRK